MPPPQCADSLGQLLVLMVLLPLRVILPRRQCCRRQTEALGNPAADTVPASAITRGLDPGVLMTAREQWGCNPLVALPTSPPSGQDRGPGACSAALAHSREEGGSRTLCMIRAPVRKEESDSHVEAKEPQL